jgi:AraC-like DNA-binding protein
MRDHYQGPITNRQLARLAHMSVRAFERRFRGSFHLTPQKYLRKLRLRVASRALVHSRQTLAEVAARCGFADQSHFTRAFRRQFGRTPGDYRAEYARGPGDAAPVPNPDADEQEPSRHPALESVAAVARSARRPGPIEEPNDEDSETRRVSRGRAAGRRAGAGGGR